MQLLLTMELCLELNWNEMLIAYMMEVVKKGNSMSSHPNGETKMSWISLIFTS